jgi:hypothetical protein
LVEKCVELDANDPALAAGTIAMKDFPTAKLIVVHPAVVVEDKLLDGSGESKAVQIEFVI